MFENFFEHIVSSMDKFSNFDSLNQNQSNKSVFINIV